VRVSVVALLSGKAVPLARGQMSAIAKSKCSGPVKIRFAGIAGDEQADPVFHGGPDKALHHYPAEHYDYWRQKAADHPLLDTPGAFGENVSTRGLTEGDVCLGDRFRLGTALIEVSQARQPCWKQGHRMEWATLPAMMVRERRSGWYYRVLEEGTAATGDDLQLIERPLPDWTVSRVFGLIIGGDHKQDRAGLLTLAQMPALFEGWRARALELYQG
jgi:MOSC domain-containing protein YiiM